RIDGQLSLEGPRRALGGQLDIALADIAPLGTLTQAVADLRGRLEARLRFAGTLAQPEINGRADLSGFAAEVPAAGLKLGDGRLGIGTRDGRSFRLDGEVGSGAGKLAVSGEATLDGAATSLRITGQGFTAADIPAAKVVVSPDLALRHD